MERDGAAIGQKADATHRHPVAGLGQNRRAAGRAGRASGEVDKAAVQIDGAIDIERAVHERRVGAHVGRAVLAYRQSAKLVAGGGIGRIEVEPAAVRVLSKTITERLKGERASGVDIRVGPVRLVTLEHDIAGAGGVTRNVAVRPKVSGAPHGDPPACV